MVEGGEAAGLLEPEEAELVGCVTCTVPCSCAGDCVGGACAECPARVAEEEGDVDARG